jgi:hypothetical protein
MSVMMNGREGMLLDLRVYVGKGARVSAKSKNRRLRVEIGVEGAAELACFDPQQ